MTTCLSWRAAVAGICLLGGAGPSWAANIQIVGGGGVSVTDQKKLGLVTVGVDCSGTLLNRSWVLTADHCITTNGVLGGPAAPFSNLRVSAGWTSAFAIPTRTVRYFASDGVDAALLYFGAGDLGPVDVQRLVVGRVNDGATVIKYGRGISQYAHFAKSTPVQASGSGTYRTARFTASSSGARTYTTLVNGSGQVANGGDSGGPDFIVQGGVMAVAGVQSTCHFTSCLAGQTCSPPGGGVDWSWVTNIDQCASGQIGTIRDSIARTIQVDMTPVSYLLNN